ncbi:MAG: HupE/UreJ family protein [Microthrixaceae bacterium]
MQRTRRLIVALVAAVGLCLGASPAGAHEPGMSAVLLDVGDTEVAAELQLPLDRLEIAVDQPLTDAPGEVVDTYGAMLTAYIGDHVAASGDDGEPWDVSIGTVSLSTIDGVDHLIAPATLTPPSGVVGDFTLDYDVILEFLLSHEIVVATQPEGGDRVVVGTLSHAASSIDIEATAPSGSVPSGSFPSMVTLGFDHVLDGADHLVFLIVLLIPAPLLLGEGRRWGGAGSPGASFARVVQVATAFTVGHSLTLVASAVGWISVPSGPVEVLVAVSIGVGAVHALRPIVAHGEALIAGGFGLIHGLAFSGILDNYGLGSGATAMSLLGFNVGVELAQLVTIALVFPSLYVLSRGRGYRRFRVGAGVAALAISLGWVVERVGLWGSPFTPLETWAVANPWVLVGALGAAALRSAIRDRQTSGRSAPEAPIAAPVGHPPAPPVGLSSAPGGLTPVGRAGRG